jgi:acyl-CoA synthetase (AMP-forming)/AMP-acid ligase II
MSAQPAWSSLVDVLEYQAQERGQQPAVAFLHDDGAPATELSFSGLAARARSVAGHLRTLGAQPGDRALLLYDSGMDFPIAYFGCLYAGMIPVPVPPPRRGKLRSSTYAIVADSGARFAFATTDALALVASELASSGLGKSVQWLTAHVQAEESLPHRLGRQAVAHLQYTSGSTSAPKGVRVTHGNVLANTEMISRVHENTAQATHVCWLPLYHDMGLVLNLLETVYVGALCVLMSPLHFITRPLAWLRAIHTYRAQVGGGPNFLFDNCVSRYRQEDAKGLDLSTWRVAINGAEPVRASTLVRFRETFAPHGLRDDALNPCYGMAEATLLISGRRRGSGVRTIAVSKKALQRNVVAGAESPEDQHVAVACGELLANERLEVIHPETRRRCAPGEIGELWVAGPHVADGYWQNDVATEETFGAEISDEPAPRIRFLRTGDLGFVQDGEVYITGRAKDVIIIRGANHYPQDLEHTAERAHPALRANFCAAFAVEFEGSERLVVVQEVERAQEANLATDDVVERVRMAVAQEHELQVAAVALIRQGTLPKTTSGKVQRRLTRERFLNGELDLISVAQVVPLTR